MKLIVLLCVALVVAASAAPNKRSKRGGPGLKAKLELLLRVLEEGEAVANESEEQAPEEQAPEEQAPEEQAPEEQAPEEHTPEEHTPEEQAPEEQAPEEQAPEEQAPEEQAPEEHTPEEHTPEEQAPEEHKPEEHTPEEQAPEEHTPEEHKPEGPSHEEHKPEEPSHEEHTPEEQAPEEDTFIEHGSGSASSHNMHSGDNSGENSGDNSGWDNSGWDNSGDNSGWDNSGDNYGSGSYQEQEFEEIVSHKLDAILEATYGLYAMPFFEEVTETFDSLDKLCGHVFQWEMQHGSNMDDMKKRMAKVKSHKRSLTVALAKVLKQAGGKRIHKRQAEGEVDWHMVNRVCHAIHA